MLTAVKSLKRTWATEFIVQEGITPDSKGSTKIWEFVAPKLGENLSKFGEVVEGRVWRSCVYFCPSRSPFLFSFVGRADTYISSFFQKEIEYTRKQYSTASPPSSPVLPLSPMLEGAQLDQSEANFRRGASGSPVPNRPTHGTAEARCVLLLVDVSL